jgi:hypothetical protein
MDMKADKTVRREKGLESGGGNKFTPTVKAPTPATAVPGDN